MALTGDTKLGHQGGNVYTNPTAIGTEYTWHTGQLVIPVAGGPPQVVQVHTPFSTKDVGFQLMRHGAPPDAPHPLSADPSLTFLGGEVSVPVPVLMGDLENRTWSISGRYVYLVNAYIEPGSDLPTGHLPVDTFSAGEGTFPASSFVQTLLAETGSGSGVVPMPTQTRVQFGTGFQIIVDS